MMVITLDNLAHRYNCLPSEALARANTFDLYVLDLSTKWVKYRNDVQEGRAPGPSSKQLTVEQMQAMIARTRSKDGDTI